MRNLIDIVTIGTAALIQESINTVTSDKTKFWYSSRENRFVDHDIDTHHIKIAAEHPEDVGLTPDEVAHHPHASGDYGVHDYSSEEDEDDDEAEVWADNNDMGIFANLFDKGWVRGGHYIDVMTYHEFGDVHHDGGIYLQGGPTRALQRCVRACVRRWPDIGYFHIECDQSEMIKLENFEEIDRFVKTGRV